MGIKVIHSDKNNFWKVGHICNLVSEFNGLVSNGVSILADPFSFLSVLLLLIISFFQTPSFKLPLPDE